MFAIIIILAAVAALVYFSYSNPDFKTKLMAVIAAGVAAVAALWDQISAMWS